MVALPLFKLGVLVVKQVSKPIANLVKTGARNSSIFKKIISSPAQSTGRYIMLKYVYWLLSYS